MALPVSKSLPLAGPKSKGISAPWGSRAGGGGGARSPGGGTGGAGPGGPRAHGAGRGGAGRGAPGEERQHVGEVPGERHHAIVDDGAHAPLRTSGLLIGDELHRPEDISISRVGSVTPPRT